MTVPKANHEWTRINTNFFEKKKKKKQTTKDAKTDFLKKKTKTAEPRVNTNKHEFFLNKKTSCSSCPSW